MLCDIVDAGNAMIYTTEINGLQLKTGDILCCTDGKPDILPGEFWRLLGRIVPGDVDHIAIYLGPEGRCVEAGALGVITFVVENGVWDSVKMMERRGLLVDSLYGVVAPLEAMGLAPEEENRIRADIAAYCLAQVGKPYNLNFLDPDIETAFYCSQLAYKAYLRHGINLNAGMGVDAIPGTERAVYPQEIWLHGKLQKKIPVG